MSAALSIVLLNWQTRDLLQRSLADALTSTAHLDVELLVVDNGSTDGSLEWVREEAGRQPAVRVLPLTHNHGPAWGFNVGLQAATGRLLMLLNTDAFLTRDAVDALLAFLDGHPGHGVVVPRLLHEDGRTQRGVMRFPTRATLIWQDSLLHRLWDGNPWRARYVMSEFDHESSRDVDQPPQAVMLLRREVFEQVGPMDVGMPVYFNDVDWCLRIRRAGWQIHYLAEQPVVHLLGGTSRKLESLWPHIFRDRIRYAAKNLSPGGATLARLALRSLAWHEAAKHLAGSLRSGREGWRQARQVLRLAAEVARSARRAEASTGEQRPVEVLGRD